ncbi:putative transposase, partial [Shigella dysenteriae 155-74]
SSALFISLLKRLKATYRRAKTITLIVDELHYPQKPGNTELAEGEPEVQGHLSAGLLAMGESC